VAEHVEFKPLFKRDEEDAAAPETAGQEEELPAEAVF